MHRPRWPGSDTGTYCYADSVSIADTNTVTDADANSNAVTYSDAHSNAVAVAYSDTDTVTDAHSSTHWKL